MSESKRHHRHNHGGESSRKKRDDLRKKILEARFSGDQKRKIRRSRGLHRVRGDIEIPLSNFEQSILMKKIGIERDRILVDFVHNLDKNEMRRKFEKCTMEERDIKVSQTPSVWGKFVYQSRMNDVIHNLKNEMTRMAQERYGNAFKIESRQQSELRKGGLLGGRYSGYEFYVHYSRDRIPNELMKVKIVRK